ncbi:MAG TPA: hypothetical protein VII06_14065 [Chloroflexota bacterium]|jgi:hypothetical protein
MSDAAQPPRSPATPRPGGRPYYIAPYCLDCGAALVLHDSLANPEAAPDEVWYDEWECPRCRGALYVDWPTSDWDAL